MNKKQKNWLKFVIVAIAILFVVSFFAFTPVPDAVETDVNNINTYSQLDQAPADMDQLFKEDRSLRSEDISAKRLADFCEQVKVYPNYYEFSDKEQLAWALSNLIRDEVAYDYSQIEQPALSWQQVLKEKRGICNEHVNLFIACCSVLGLECNRLELIPNWNIDINKINNDIPFGSIHAVEFERNHFFVSVNIDGIERYLDPSTSEQNDLYLFLNKWIFTSRDFVSHEFLTVYKGGD